MIDNINILNSYKRLLFILMTIPFILIGSIYISNGETFDKIILDNLKAKGLLTAINGVTSIEMGYDTTLEITPEEVSMPIYIAPNGKEFTENELKEKFGNQWEDISAQFEKKGLEIPIDPVTKVREYSTEINFYQLQSQLKLFKYTLTDIPSNILPKITSSIGYYCIISIYILFSAWLGLFVISSYMQIDRKIGSKILILIELALISTIFVVSISPNLNLWLSALGYLILSSFTLLLALFWVHEIKSNS
jgi:uncharacterized membrane protein